MRIHSVMGALAVSLMALTAHAVGGIAGNGGGAWACVGPNQKVEWIEIIDLFEAREEFGLTLDDAVNGSTSVKYDVLIEERLRKVEAVLPDFGKSLRRHVEIVEASKRMVATDLSRLDDALFRVVPSAESCPRGAIEFVQVANYTGYDKVLVNQRIWNLREFSELSKAALIFHEAVYRKLREDQGEIDSVRSRRIVGLVFAKITERELLKEISEQMGLFLPPFADGLQEKVRLSYPDFKVAAVSVSEDKASAYVGYWKTEGCGDAMASSQKKTNLLVAYDLNTGANRWSRGLEEICGVQVSVDDSRVFVLSNHKVLSFESKTGRPLETFDPSRQLRPNTYLGSTSRFVYASDKLVVVQLDGTGPYTEFLFLDVATGKVLNYEQRDLALSIARVSKDRRYLYYTSWNAARRLANFEMYDLSNLKWTGVTPLPVQGRRTIDVILSGDNKTILYKYFRTSLQTTPSERTHVFGRLDLATKTKLFETSYKTLGLNSSSLFEQGDRFFVVNERIHTFDSLTGVWIETGSAHHFVKSQVYGFSDGWFVLGIGNCDISRPSCEGVGVYALP